MNNDIKINLENMLYGYYIKYDKLFQITNECFKDVESDILDIYVDLYDMLKPVYKRDIYTNKNFVIVSAIINLAAHLRGYYWTRHRVQTRIFLVHGDNITLSHKQFCQTFGDDEFRGMLNYNRNNEFIHSQLELVKILAGYIYDVYYIPKKSDFSSFVFGNIMNNPNTPAVVLTKSKYAYQIPALCKNAVLFRPKKNVGEDVSFYVDQHNVNQLFYPKISSQETRQSLQTINPQLLSILITMTGMYDYKLTTLMNITQAVKILKYAIDHNKINNVYNTDTDYLYNALDGIVKYVDPVTFKYRFNAVDLVFQHRIYNSTAESKDISWLINLSDPNTVRYINNTYFADNPLDLNSL
jgi:hypothetical protein